MTYGVPVLSAAFNFAGSHGHEEELVLNYHRRDDNELDLVELDQHQDSDILEIFRQNNLLNLNNDILQEDGISEDEH